jgi:hypothetical protein
LRLLEATCRLICYTSRVKQVVNGAWPGRLGKREVESLQRCDMRG